MVLFYEKTSPLSFLESVSDGAKAPQTDVKLVESLLFDYQLQPGVVNVLVDYAMRLNNMKLVKNFVQTIAGQWSRKKIYTVEDAMELAKREYQEKKKRAQQESSRSTSSNNKNRSTRPYVRKDKLPKWLENDNNQEKTAESKQEEETKLNEEKQQFEEMLRLRKSSRQK
ncbi:hypothetical protein D7Z54_07070 [Salibacterium salarium]|uniref:DnaB/C C-terminal domain-containing protein n=2 Tax=Salibacterium salarium TaxID=284579 RepID=A0A428N7F0_9BACI|nr:DnaD domain protein [Salibacterium salarium]RSL34307.1 hypothetical protein D7Z54_07070 [Salibacterium salarium]